MYTLFRAYMEPSDIPKTTEGEECRVCYLYFAQITWVMSHVVESATMSFPLSFILVRELLDFLFVCFSFSFQVANWKNMEIILWSWSSAFSLLTRYQLHYLVQRFYIHQLPSTASIGYDLPFSDCHAHWTIYSHQEKLEPSLSCIRKLEENLCSMKEYGSFKNNMIHSKSNVI